MLGESIVHPAVDGRQAALERTTAEQHGAEAAHLRNVHKPRATAPRLDEKTFERPTQQRPAGRETEPTAGLEDVDSGAKSTTR